MAGVDHLVVYMQTAVKYSGLYICHPVARRAPGVVYIESVVFYSSLNIHHQIVHKSHFPIFSRPQPGGGVYLWGPNDIILQSAWNTNKNTQNLQSSMKFDYLGEISFNDIFFLGGGERRV